MSFKPAARQHKLKQKYSWCYHYSLQIISKLSSKQNIILDTIIHGKYELSTGTFLPFDSLYDTWLYRFSNMFEVLFLLV